MKFVKFLVGGVYYLGVDRATQYAKARFFGFWTARLGFVRTVRDAFFRSDTSFSILADFDRFLPILNQSNRMYKINLIIKKKLLDDV